MEETIKIGDRVLVRQFGIFGNGVFHAHIIAIKKGWFGKNVYYGQWTVYVDTNDSYKKGGALHWWNIICKS